MKKLVYLFVSLFLVVVAAENVNAQINNATVGEALASANIIAPITLENETSLDFGNIIAGTGGTVVMTTSNSRSATGNVTLQPDINGTAAKFNVTGLSSAIYSIQLPTDVLLEGDNGGDMTINNFKHNAGDSPTILNNPSFNVGATLNVNDEQEEGTYTGTYAVTVAYN